MSSVMSNPEGLKVVECKSSVGSKKAPIRYIPEQDPVQDALKKTKKSTYFKLILPNTGNELKVAIWASGTPEQFLLHLSTAMHVCKQIGLETKEANAMMVLDAAQCKLNATKVEYAKLAKNAKQKAKEAKEKEETPAPEGKKKAREPKEQADIRLLTSLPTHLPQPLLRKHARIPPRWSRKQSLLSPQQEQNHSNFIETFSLTRPGNPGKNHPGPSDTSTLGGCLQNPTYQDSHQKLVIIP